MFTPSIRPRRLRRTPTLREMVRETVVQPNDFIYPLFIKHGKNERVPIRSLPGIAQLSIDEAVYLMKDYIA
ncbi:MAG: porphobilinogen synthase, partial [bacterium]